MNKKNKKKKSRSMSNITINIPDIYDDNIQEMIKMGIVASRSEAIRTAIREYLQKEYDVNLKLLGFLKEE
jgi:Arc/MetJ-type ribon-helix-helix transcriptional regulator